MNLAPNYFSESSWTGFDARDGFFAQRTLMSHYNGAAKLHMTWIRAEDTDQDKQRKLKFAENWKNWRLCLDLSVTKPEKTAFHYFLRKPDDFLGFLYEISEETLAAYYKSYQEFLWNKMLKKILNLNPEKNYLEKLSIPLFADRAEMTDSFLRKIEREVLAEEKIERSMFGKTKFRKVRFKTGFRKALATYC